MTLTTALTLKKGTLENRRSWAVSGELALFRKAQWQKRVTEKEVACWHFQQEQTDNVEASRNAATKGMWQHFSPKIGN